MKQQCNNNISSILENSFSSSRLGILENVSHNGEKIHKGNQGRWSWNEFKASATIHEHTHNYNCIFSV